MQHHCVVVLYSVENGMIYCTVSYRYRVLLCAGRVVTQWTPAANSLLVCRSPTTHTRILQEAQRCFTVINRPATSPMIYIHAGEALTNHYIEPWRALRARASGQ